MISYSWFIDCSLIGEVMFISTERKMFIFRKSGISWKCIPKQIAIQNLIWCKFSYGPMMIKFEKSRSLTENCIHLSSFVSSEETQIVSRQEKWTKKSVNKNSYNENWYTEYKYFSVCKSIEPILSGSKDISSKTPPLLFLSLNYVIKGKSLGGAQFVSLANNRHVGFIGKLQSLSRHLCWYRPMKGGW